MKIFSIPAGRKPLLPWLLSVATESILRISGSIFSLPVPALSQSVSRRSNLLIKELNKVSNPDWVIGHNPGAIWPVLYAAKKFNCRAGFDVEDYHPGEGNNKYLQSLVKKLMVRLLPKMDYVSFAAPLIFEQVNAEMDFNLTKWLTIPNYFPASDFAEPTILVDQPLKLVWFSQNISAGRGLELVLPIIKKAAVKLELHLIGNLDQDFYKNHLKEISNVLLHPPMKQYELHQSLGQFDIGLALEPAKDKNNELAVSNKILAYLQAGLFVVATNTPAQESYLKEFPGHGICFDYRANNAETVFEKIIDEVNTIRSQRITRYKNFENRNWESTSQELLATWNK